MLRSALKANSNQTLPTGVWQTIRYLVNEPMLLSETATAAAAATQTTTTTTTNNLAGFTRLWRGVQTMFIGCIPAHALYFSSYELVKATGTTKDGHVTPVTSSLAGAAAVTAHDLIMTPLDTIKQRIQLGHYNGSVQQAVKQIIQTEGWSAFYRSFPVTLASNIPYGMVMVSTNEACKQAWMTHPEVAPSWQTVLLASSVAGCVASAVTTPLDRIKTSLQTQQMAPASCQWQSAFGSGRGIGRRRGRAVGICQLAATNPVRWSEAAHTIWKQEGAAGFFRGVVPRVMSHTPAVAISWTTYETLKQYLMRQY